MPKIFIFIPLYNAEKFIAQTIESVLQQTFTDWELLVLDDCSTDNSFQIAQIFEQKDKRIRVQKNAENLGMMGNWNEGIKYCHSKYFVKLDADDLWHNEMIEKSVEILDNIPEVALIFTKYINIDENGSQIPDSEIILPDFAKDKAFSCVPLVQQGTDKMLSYSILRQGLSVMRSKIFQEIGVYRHLLSEETQASTDTEFYFRVGCHYQIYCIDTVFYFYRIHLKSISSEDKNKGLQEQKMYEVKTAITNYYYQQGKINHSIKNKYQKIIKFEYYKYLVYAHRHKRNYLTMFYFLFYNLSFNTIKTIQFYFKRILNKNE